MDSLLRYFPRVIVVIICQMSTPTYKELIGKERFNNICYSIGIPLIDRYDVYKQLYTSKLIISSNFNNISNNNKYKNFSVETVCLYQYKDFFIIYDYYRAITLKIEKINDIQSFVNKCYTVIHRINFSYQLFFSLIDSNWDIENDMRFIINFFKRVHGYDINDFEKYVKGLYLKLKN